MSLDTRLLDPKNDDELTTSLALFETVYRRKMSAAFYRWRFIDNPFGPPMVALAWDGNTLAGHYSVAPARAQVAGSTVLAAQSMTTMTHPDYRNRGIFTLLATYLYERMAEHGAKVVWGFPNTQSHYGFVQKLGWQDVGLVATMTRRISRESSTPNDSNVAEVDVGPWVTSLFETSAGSRSFPSVKDEAYVRWRYVRNPEQTYRYFGKPGEALVVTKDYDTAGGRALELVDSVGGADAVGATMAALVGWATTRGYALVRTWASLTDALYPHLERQGFAPAEPLAYFGGRALGDFTLPPDGWTLPRWCVTMGNSDNY
jgi:GNAT superfamily N-acetyltransferase